MGYVGRDVETIIRDLVETGVKMLREQAMEEVAGRAKSAAEERVLDALLPPARAGFGEEPVREESSTRALFRSKLHKGELDDKEIEVELAQVSVGVEIMAPPGMEDMTSQIQNMFSSLGGERKNKRKLKVKDALARLQDEEAANLLNMDDIKARAVEAVEQNGIVFIDELDKVAKRNEHGSGGDVSREGVQRDLLPLIEGCTVSTKYGMIKTDHILFIASGAFHFAKPSDLIPELQGRLPIRVELKALTPEDFKRILTEPDASLTQQYKALLATEGLHIQFSDDGISAIAEMAFNVNKTTENIGARRLHTMLERLLEKVSFDAESLAAQYNAQNPLTINAAFVKEHLGELVQDEDLSRFIL